MEPERPEMRQRPALMPDDEMSVDALTVEGLQEENRRLRHMLRQLETCLQWGEERRRAMVHLMSDLQETNRRLADQRKAMLHILADHEKDRARLASQTVRLDNSRRALLHILQDVHQTNIRLESSRKAMIHIMRDLRDTTEQIQHREQELREKQEQLIQAGKLATLGELTTGIAHELNNPLNNIGLFLGNVIDHLDLGRMDKDRIIHDLRSAMQQVRKASEIISHLRTFGRAAPMSREPVPINDIIRRSLSLMQEQLRLRQIETRFDLAPENPLVRGNAIQLEQVLINLLTNARDAVGSTPEKVITVRSGVKVNIVEILVQDSGMGIPRGLEQWIFDSFFSTMEVGEVSGLWLSCMFGINK